MKIEKFQLRGNNSLCAEAFQLLRGRAPAQLRGNVAQDPGFRAAKGSTRLRPHGHCD
jgi:hypothetical protein